MTPVLEAYNLRKSFRVHGHSGRAGKIAWKRQGGLLRAVDDVSLAIGTGEAVGLVGESGCGKSTLARLLARLVEPDEGTLRFDGKDVATVALNRFPRSPLRRSVQMVFQDPTESLNPRFTAFASIAYPVRRLLPGLGRAAIIERVEAAAAQVGLALPLLQRLPHQLSGGEKARVGIARAMAVEPRLLVLDEPTSALDVSVQATVLKLLWRLRRDAGVALLFVSHDLNLVRLLCDRILVMYLGQIVEEGPAGAVFESPRHPYTEALLSAAPHLPNAGAGPAVHLAGEPHSPIDPDPNACRLHGRCPRETELCTARPPALDAVAPGHAVRCFFPG